ncbi:MAG TPA: hypothetical protein VMG09_03550 [Bacteroidota bacterium]|nr:hypothetical protein [Bacteroidota bacterium]
MRQLLSASLILLAVIALSCSQGSVPNGPPPATQTPVGHAGPLSVVGYGETLDSSYYKVWSDNTWEEYSGDTMINGIVYTIIMDNSGYENFYSPAGYAGFGQYGSSPILFDSVLASVPDTMVVGTTYTAQTTFMYQGSSNVLIDQETLVDSGTVTVPFGTFTNCRVMSSVGAINGVLQYATVYWLAQGPSDIAREYSTAYGPYDIQMSYGEVNGIEWGVPSSALARRVPGAAGEAPNMILRAPNGSLRSPGTMQSIAPGIIRGIMTSRMLRTAHPLMNVRRP